MSVPEKPKDIYRDTYLRYLGYANEVGEAFRPLVHKNFVHLSYGVAVSYVLADAYDKGAKVHRETGNVGKVAISAGDVFLWQMLASVIIPGFTINRLTWATARAIKHMKMNKNVKRYIPTGVGLMSIPAIIHPIDQFVDAVMDKTYRKYLK